MNGMRRNDVAIKTDVRTTTTNLFALATVVPGLFILVVNFGHNI
jgi:hypothetical protein